MAVHVPERHAARDRAAQTKTGHTLLVGYDGSEEARAAFKTAIERAGRSDTIVVVNAHEPVSAWLGMPYYQRAVEDTLRAGRGILDELRAVAAASPADVRFEQHEGPPAEVLARIASTREVDEIIVGSRGLGRLRAALGSVSRALLRSADRPVLVVPAKAAEHAER
jgi:nucleotide-binding universal stress UspA family protein